MNSLCSTFFIIYFILDYHLPFFLCVSDWAGGIKTACACVYVCDMDFISLLKFKFFFLFHHSLLLTLMISPLYYYRVYFTYNKINKEKSVRNWRNLFSNNLKQKKMKRRWKIFEVCEWERIMRWASVRLSKDYLTR